METKVCSRCGETKAAAAFYQHKGKPNGHCKPCSGEQKKARYAADAATREKVKARSAAHYAANKDRHRAVQREYARANGDHLRRRSRERFLMTKYGITQADYDALLVAQDGVCAVCLGPPRHGKTNFCVDHCHDTGRVRGLLCDYCNRAAGSLENDAARAERLSAYLA